MHNAVLRLVRDRLAWYAPGVTGEPRWLDAQDNSEQLRTLLAQQRSVVCFAVPGTKVRLQRLEVSAGERKHVGKSLAFMLEEEVAADIDQLHFAWAAMDKTHLAVAICARAEMLDWQRQLADYPAIKLWLPEPLLLPWQPGEWCVVLDGDDAIVRSGACEGFGCEREMLPLMLAGLLQECEAPQAVICYGQEQAADLALLPESLRGSAQWRRGNLGAALMLQDNAVAPVNLLQGEFTARLPLGRWWREWRAVAACFAVAVALHLVATYTDYARLKRDNLALRTAVQSSYRQAYPEGAVVDAEKQLGRQLGALRGSGQASGFVYLLDRVGAAVADHAGTAIATINYSDKAGEMRMNILAADFEAVERVRAAINKAGLQAVMESSSAQGDKVRARLRVGEPS